MIVRREVDDCSTPGGGLGSASLIQRLTGGNVIIVVPWSSPLPLSLSSSSLSWEKVVIVIIKVAMHRWQDDVTGFVSITVERVEGVFLVLRPESAVREEAAVRVSPV